jgi:hypothetical protein
MRILYENRRRNAWLKTLALSGWQPRFLPSGLGEGGRRPPFGLKLLKLDEVTGINMFLHGGVPCFYR